MGTSNEPLFVHIWVTDHVEVKIVGYWPSIFGVFFRIFMDQDIESKLIQTRQSRTRPVLDHLEQTNKLWKYNTIFLQNTSGNPKWAR